MISIRPSPIIQSVALVACLAGDAHAQSPCGADPSTWLMEYGPTMEGFWRDEMMALERDGQAAPLQEHQTLGLIAIPGGFHYEGPGGAIRYDLLLTDRDFALDPPPGALWVAGAEFEQVLQDCEVSDLPRLLVRRRVVIDGMGTDLTVSIVITDTETMHAWSNMNMASGTLQQYSILRR